MKTQDMPFGDFATFKYGKMPVKSRVSASGKYPLYSGYRYVGFYDEYNTDENTLVIVARGVGGTGKVKLTKERCYLTNLSIAASVNEKIALPQYLYYYFSVHDLRYLDSGSAQSQITITDLSKVTVSLPPLEEQQKVCAILGALDDKIALNTQINDNLQRQARTLFQSWFVDCETTDWKKGLLKDVLYLKRDSIKSVNKNASLPYLPIDSIPMNTFAISEVRPNEEAKSSLVAFHTDDIIIGAMRVYFHRVIPAPFDGITRTTCFTLTPYDPDYFCFSLLLCDQESSIQYAQKTSKGSTILKNDKVCQVD